MERSGGDKKECESGKGVLTHSLGACDGQLIRMTDDLIPAGAKNHYYILYTCERCGDFVTVGGEGNIPTK